MLLGDSHVHSAFSADASVPMENMLQTALHQGMKYFYITDHHDIDYPIDAEGLDFNLAIRDYLQALQDLESAYGDRIHIKKGLELGLMRKSRDKINAFTKEYYSQLDFVIGSSHLVNGADPYYPDFFEGRSEEESYGEYFQSILDNVRSFQDYDVYGHLDYVVRYGPNKDLHYHPEQYYNLFREILSTIISGGKGIEINTGSLYKGFSWMHPQVPILKLYKQLGGEIITIGSDAHKQEHFAYGFKEAERLLYELGFRAYSIYEQHEPKFFDIK